MDEYNALLFRGCIATVDTVEPKWIVNGGDIRNYRGHQAYIEIMDDGPGGFSVEEIRFGNGPAPTYPETPFESMLLEKGKKNPAQLSKRLLAKVLGAPGQASPLNEAQQKQLVNFFVNNDLLKFLPSDVGTNATAQPSVRLADLRKKLAAASARVPAPEFAIAMTDGTGENEHIYIRGNNKTLGEVVQRDVLTALRTSQLKIDKGSGRLSLANEIADPDNPLTARVAVNRIWHHMLGVGIVPSVDNFGVLGQSPTHPELLDYLANEFVGDQWSVKRMVRRIALSQTYQQSSKPDPKNLTADPTNQFLHRANVKRLTGESIRDSMLLVSGELNDTMYGEPVKVHLTSFMSGRGRPRQSGPLDGHGRRSIYLEVRRNFLSPMMLAFDTPIPFNSIGRRNRSNVPAQALMLMNSPLVVEQAAKWAERLESEHGEDTDQKIRSIYQTAFSRPVLDEELETAKSFLESQSAASDSKSAWQDFCHVILNTKEFIYIR